MTTKQQIEDPWASVFNTPIECGLRSSALLMAIYPQTCDIQRLVQYDYLIVHSGDVEGGPQSIHPATPHRAGELLVRRSLVERGLEFMTVKQIVEKVFTALGITYRAGEYAAVFLDSFESRYVQELRNRANWVAGRFQDMVDQELSVYMREQWSTWGSEFVHESILYGVEE
jgi:hypothetical protein